MEKGSPADFVVGLGIGLGTGVLIGILLAPKSGREARQVIRNSAAEGEEYLEQRGAELRDTLKGSDQSGQPHTVNITSAPPPICLPNALMAASKSLARSPEGEKLLKSARP